MWIVGPPFVGAWKVLVWMLSKNSCGRSFCELAPTRHVALAPGACSIDRFARPDAHPHAPHRYVLVGGEAPRGNTHPPLPMHIAF